jgi:uncharacterized membrane protein YfcA
MVAATRVAGIVSVRWKSAPRTRLQFFPPLQQQRRRTTGVSDAVKKRASQQKPPSPPAPPPNLVQQDGGTATKWAVVAPTSLAIGTLAGALGSLAGMGGGFVMIPLMTSRLLRLSQHQAHGTSLFAVGATGIAGAVSYGNGRSGDGGGHGQDDPVVRYPESAAIALTAMATSRLGARATRTLSERTLKRALGVLMLSMAPAVPAKVYYMQESRVAQAATTTPTIGTEEETVATKKSRTDAVRFVAGDWAQYDFRSLLAPAVIGLGSGYLAGVFGVGGGTPTCV